MNQESSPSNRTQVRYSEFGAKGDGVTNDIAAIIATHAYANEHGLPVRGDAGAVYYVSTAEAGAIVRTDVDWTGCSFIIDDSGIDMEARSVAIFTVAASKSARALDVPLDAVQKGQSDLPITLPEDSILVLVEAGTKKYIREGANRNAGSDQTDIVVVDRNGHIDEAAPILWDYTHITSARVVPMDERTLTLTGGTFTTIANRQPTSNSYFARGIKICRSNVVVDSLTHYVEGEGDHGSPYWGILVIQDCANVTVKNCTFTAHKTYSWMKPTGWVSQGSYDISPSRVINLTFENCTQTTDILDTAYWGVMGSNFCKNITLTGCTFSRFDAHQGVANVTIRDCTLGHQCLNAIGSGTLRLENTRLYGRSLVNLRPDYGSTWEGSVIIKNCTWTPDLGNTLGGGVYPIFDGYYSGFHNFGYDCYMPENIEIENLRIEDANADENYRGVCLFSAFTPDCTNEAYEQKIAAEGYPHHPPKRVTLRGFTASSGKKWRISPNPFFFRNVEIVER